MSEAPYRRICILSCAENELRTPGECVKCPDYMIANNDKSLCEEAICNENQIVEVDGSCKTCPEGIKPDGR